MYSQRRLSEGFKFVLYFSSEARLGHEAGFELGIAHQRHDTLNRPTEEAQVRTMSINEYIAGALGGRWLVGCLVGWVGSIEERGGGWGVGESGKGL